MLLLLLLFVLISENVAALLENEKTTIYCGADPSAQSLHVGNLVPLIILQHFRSRGHNVIALVGGATGIVGDPSGRSTERAQMESDARAHNITKIRGQLETILDRGMKYLNSRGYAAENFGNGESANNADWWKDMGMLHFLGTYGRHIRVGHMLARDSVKNRMESEQGIGFNEFTYQVLQAYDFWHLHSQKGCKIQVGGNDQWGNITAGIDLISRLRAEILKKQKESEKEQKKKNAKTSGNPTQQKPHQDSNIGLLKIPKNTDPAYGITVPLLTTPSGEKFGKSAGNAIWIDPAMTKPFDLYQYFVKAPDSVVHNYLKMFTFLPLDTISQIMETHTQDEAKRFAQRVLAKEVTNFVHGLGSGTHSEVLSEILFGGSQRTEHSTQTIIEAFETQDLVMRVKRSDLVGSQWRTVLSELTGKSLSEIGRLINGNGVYKGLDRTPVTNSTIESSDLTENKMLLVRIGKSKYFIIEAVE